MKSPHNSLWVAVFVLFGIFGYIAGQLIVQTNLLQPKPQTLKFQTLQMRDSVSDALFKKKPNFSKDDLNKELALSYKIKKEEDLKTAPNRKNFIFNQIPDFLVWNILIGIMMCIAFSSIPASVFIMKSYYQNFSLKTIHLSIPVAFTLIIGGIIILCLKNTTGLMQPDIVVNSFHILLENGQVFKWIESTTIMCSLFMVAVLFLSAFCADRIQRLVSTNRIDEIKDKIKLVQSFKSIALLFITLQIVMTILTSGTLGNVVRNVITIQNFEVFPKSVTYVYGLHFTLFLCVIYLPVHFYINLCFTRIKEALLRDEAAGNLDKIEEINEAIKLEVDLWSRAKTWLAMLAPFLSALVPDLFEAFMN